MRGGRCAGWLNYWDACRRRSSGGWAGVGRARRSPTGLFVRVTAPTGCLNASNGGSSPEVSPATGARIACRLRLVRSSVGRVLKRYRMPLLAHVDRAAGAQAPAGAP